MTLHKDLIDLSNLIDSIIRDHSKEILGMEKKIDGVMFSLPSALCIARDAINNAQLCYDIHKGLNDD